MPLSPAPPPARWAPGPATSGGQAAVELVALLPFIALLLAAGYQGVGAGDPLWGVPAAARAAARASSFGADAPQPARAPLPSRLEQGLRVHAESGGDVRVSLRIPKVIPAVRLGSVAATAHFQPQGG